MNYVQTIKPEKEPKMAAKCSFSQHNNWIRHTWLTEVNTEDFKITLNF